MKKILNISLVLAALIFLCGCSKSFLDRYPSTSVSTGSLKGNLYNTQMLMIGIYQNMAAYRTNHDDSGMTTYFIYNDIKGNDVIVPTNWYCYQHWFLRSQRMQTHARARYIWQWAYEYINNCNLVIDSAEGMEGDAWKRVEMEARVIRAYMYRALLQHYQQHVRVAGLNAPGVPLNLTPATGNKEVDGKPRGTLKEVYDAILADLQWAVQNGLASRDMKGKVNTNVANGVLARVYLDLAYADEALGSGTSSYWQKAIDAARAARSGYPLMEATVYRNGFNDINAVSECIWGLKQNGTGNINYPAFYSFYDVIGARNGYKNFRASETFTALFAPEDSRNLFRKASRINANHMYDTIVKFRDKSDMLGDLMYMRSSEMYFLEAECLVNKGGGDFTAAQALINEVLAKRITGFTPQTPLATKNEMLMRIWVERRKELYGEGFAMPDINRLSFISGIGAERSAHWWAYIAATRGDIPVGDNCWGFFQQIPKPEFDNNPALDIDKDQNPLNYPGI